MPRPRARPTGTLLIDGMGTLVTLQDPVPRLVAVLRDRFGAEVSAAEARRALGAEIAHYRVHMQEGRDAAGLARLRRRCAQVLRDALPPHPALDSADPTEMTEALLAALHFAAFPDARPGLARIRAAGGRVIVVSNWDVSLIDVLERAGLAALTDAIVTSAAVGARKPERAIFDHALALAATTADDPRLVHVGDSVTEDVAGAQARGIRPVLVDRDGTRWGDAPAGVSVIADLAGLRWPPVS